MIVESQPQAGANPAVARTPGSGTAARGEGARTIWQTALYRYDEAARLIGLAPDLHRVLRSPERSLIVSVPVRLDTGDIEVFEGYRVQHNQARGPSKGGIRYAPDLTLDMCRALAMWNTWKCAVMQIPFGGAMGGVVCNPRRLSAGEIERVTRRYTAGILKFIGPDQDVPKPDLGTNEQIMAWVMDTYSMTVGHAVPGVTTGKPVNIGGSAGRQEEPGRSITFSLMSALKPRGAQLARMRAAVQGFGRVGYTTARFMARQGSRIVAVSDSRGAVRNDAGLDPEKLYEHKKRTGTVADYPDGTAIREADLFAAECDVLVAAAVEGTIDAETARTVKATVLVEAANGPTTIEAERVLLDRDIFIVPDIFALAGDMMISYFEWVQGLQSYFWSEREVSLKIREAIFKAYDRVAEVATNLKVPLRTAAYVLGIGAVADAHRIRGLYP